MRLPVNKNTHHPASPRGRVRRHPLIAALPALSLLLVAGAAPQRPAAAQVNSPLPIRLKAGVLLPSSGETKRETSNTHFAAEVDVFLPITIPYGGNIATVGYYENFSGDRKLRTIPITLSTISSPSNPVGAVTGNLYYGGGIGAYIMQASGGGEPSKSGTRFGGFLVVGYQTPTNFFAEAKYIQAGDVDGLRPNGFTFFIGTRL